MKALLFGSTGQLGTALCRHLAGLIEIDAQSSQSCDLRHTDALTALIAASQPDVIINAAAYTHVDQAESEPDVAFAVNAEAPGIMAGVAADYGIPILHYSTDYVFDGEADHPYQESDDTSPINTYGKSKLEGERQILQAGGRFIILRTSWLYSMDGDSFPVRVLAWARQQPVLHIVTDQVGSPTRADDLAAASAVLVERCLDDPGGWFDRYGGLYHLAGGGSVSRFDWAREILSLAPAAWEVGAVQVQPTLSSAFPSPAVRPAFSALSSATFFKRFGFYLPHWKESLDRALSTASPV